MSGAKTYLVGLGLIAWGVIQIAVLDSTDQGVQSILEGAGLMALRRGVKTAQEAAVKAAEAGPDRGY